VVFPERVGPAQITWDVGEEGRVVVAVRTSLATCRGLELDHARVLARIASRISRRTPSAMVEGRARRDRIADGDRHLTVFADRRPLDEVHVGHDLMRLTSDRANRSRQRVIWSLQRAVGADPEPGSCRTWVRLARGSASSTRVPGSRCDLDDSVRSRRRPLNRGVGRSASPCALRGGGPRKCAARRRDRPTVRSNDQGMLEVASGPRA